MFGVLFHEIFLSVLYSESSRVMCRYHYLCKEVGSGAKPFEFTFAKNMFRVKSCIVSFDRLDCLPFTTF